MAVQNFQTTQMVDDTRLRPTEKHGKLRFAYFVLPATTVVGDATSTVDLCELPSGQVRVLPNFSRITTSAFGAGRTLSIGHYAYSKADNTTEAQNATAFVAALDVSGAVSAAAWSTVLKYDVYSKGGVALFATVNVNTIPVGAVIEGFCAYLYE